MKELLRSDLINYKLIFFDFDGVIKDSNRIKTQAFQELFKEFGNKISSKVVNHHIQNMGISRYDKITYYYKEFLNTSLNKNELQNICEKFSKIVINQVINSDWIPGSLEFLRNNSFNHKFVIVTGTPEQEIKIILNKLNIINCFHQVSGSPNKKIDIVSKYLNKYGDLNNKCLFIGDSTVDLNAALNNNISFVYRFRENGVEEIFKSANFYINDFLGLI